MELGLNGKVVLVTAVAGGIGHAIAEQLSAEGAVVIGVDLDPPQSAPGVTVRRADLLAPGVIDGIVAEMVVDHGHVDGLVAVLGGPSPSSKPFVERTDADWRGAFDLNLLSAVRAARAVLGAMPVEGGSLVFVGSDLARQPDPAFAEYSAMKAALLSLSKSLSIECGPLVRSNVLSPGPTRTPGLERDFEEHIGPALGLPAEDAIERYVTEIRRMPSGRLALPPEIARAAAFLLSPASAPMTGAELVIDGGSRAAS